jgi:hypothetical protein
MAEGRVVGEFIDKTMGERFDMLNPFRGWLARAAPEFIFADVGYILGEVLRSFESGSRICLSFTCSI